MGLVRVLRTSQQTITRQIYTDETLTDAAGSVSVTVKRLDGTTLTSGTATDAPGPGAYSFVLPGGLTSPGSVTWQLDHLDVIWSGSVGGATVELSDRVEVVGGHLFGLAEARAKHQFITSMTDFPTELIADTRIEIEQEFERICRQAFVPRFDREILDGNDTVRLALKVGNTTIRRVRAVTIGGVALSAGDVAAIGHTDYGVLLRPTGALWPAGLNNIIVEYEHGLDNPPEEVRAAAILRLRSKLSTTTSGIPDRALSYNTPEGNTFRLSIPSRDRIGIPEIDGVLERYRGPRRVVFA